MLRERCHQAWVEQTLADVVASDVNDPNRHPPDTRLLGVRLRRTPRLLRIGQGQC